MRATNMLWVMLSLATQASSAVNNYASNPAVQLFQEYLQINTTTGNDLTPAVQFWTRLAAAENLPISVHEFTPGYPVIIIKLAGSDPSLSSIMLTSHMDVVPAYEDDGWTHPPFSGHLDANGDIYGRGSQDMKSVSIQNFEALKKLKANNATLLRTVFMALMPDEELGGQHGIIPFLASAAFAALKVGVAMDEGAPYPLSQMALFYQDKVVWQFQVECRGIAGHGSTFPATNATATGKCSNVINRLFQFRNEQYKISEVATIFNAGTYSSVNLNKINAGTANNIIPEEVRLVYDMRPKTTLNADRFEAELRQWLAEAGTDITLTYILKNQQSPATILNATNPYWTAVANAVQTLGVSVLPLVAPGSTDARYVRDVGIPAFGFSPMPNTPLLLHSTDERLNAAVFLQGINIYETFITNLANIPADQTDDTPFAYVMKTDL